LSEGDILVARMPDPIGRACIFPLKGENKYVTAVDVAIIRVDNEIVDKNYLLYSINNPKYRNSIQDLESGTTRKRISRKNLSILEFSLPPIPTQLAIVSKIEELFSELDKGIENLRVAQHQLKTYRQSVLKWAFEGKLTEEWRSLIKKTDFRIEFEKVLKEREDKFNIKVAKAKANKEPKTRTPKNLDKKFKVSQDYVRFVCNIPKEWLVVHLAVISSNMPDSIVDGPFGSSINVEEDYVEKGVPVIRINNILQFWFEKNKLKFIREGRFAELKRHNVLPGDVLFGKVGTIGNSCIYPIGEPEAMLSTTGSCRIRVDEKIITNKYLCYYLNSRKNNFNEIASAAVQAFLNMETINNFPIPICSIEEQNRIIQEIESRLSVADKMEESITQSLQQAEALRQSILKKAFEGNLV
jgi:type I restriction enzyme S subunit